MQKYLLILLFFFLPSIASAQTTEVKSGVYTWANAPIKQGDKRETRTFLQGSTKEFSFFKVHATTQLKGAAPKPAHTLDSIEELIIIKEGTLKCTVGDTTCTLSAGSVLLIPPGVKQQLENTGNTDAAYYVFQFKAYNTLDKDRSNKSGGAIFCDIDSLPYVIKNEKGSRNYFNKPTAMCQNYEMHTTTLYKKGPSHAAHQHVDTEIILVITGQAEITIDGQYYKAAAGDFFIANSNTMHQVGNMADATCSYFAFKWR